MSRQATPRPLILMPCSGMKLDRPAPAAEIYTGVMWTSLRVNLADLRPGQLPHIVTLSAKHGFLKAQTVIDPYEQRMTPERARELHYDVDRFVTEIRWPRSATRVLIAGGGLYREVMRRMIGALQREGVLAGMLHISEVVGGIGEQRSQLGRFVRDPSSLPVSFAAYHSSGVPCFHTLGAFTLGDRVRPQYASHGKPQPAGTVVQLFDGGFGPTADVLLDDERDPELQARRPRPYPLSRWVGLRHLVPLATEVGPLRWMTREDDQEVGPDLDLDEPDDEAAPLSLEAMA